MCCLAVPFTPISAYGHTWHLGRILCHLVPMSLGISGRILRRSNSSKSLVSLVYVSTLTSLAIAVDRYFVIVHPFRSRMRLGVCILLIIVIWIVGISISLPLAIYMRFDTAKCEVSERQCNERVCTPHSRSTGRNTRRDASSISRRWSCNISSRSPSSRSATTKCGSHLPVGHCRAERAFAKKSRSFARSERTACSSPWW